MLRYRKRLNQELSRNQTTNFCLLKWKKWTGAGHAQGFEHFNWAVDIYLVSPQLSNLSAVESRLISHFSIKKFSIEVTTFISIGRPWLPGIKNLKIFSRLTVKKFRQMFDKNLPNLMQNLSKRAESFPCFLHYWQNLKLAWKPRLDGRYSSTWFRIIGWARLFLIFYHVEKFTVRLIWYRYSGFWLGC